MKKLNLSLLMLLALVFSTTFLTSCGEDDGCTQEDYVDTFVGKYFLFNFIELTNNDTAVVTIDGNSLSIESALLGNTFLANYNSSTNTGEVSNLSFPQFIIGGDTLFDISVESGSVELDNNCNRLYISLQNVTVLSGTVNLPDPLSYPIRNASMETKNGLVRQ
ncbi:MAG: hypothetical protein R2728_03745 [Chitinophagales bacterium]